MKSYTLRLEEDEVEKMEKEAEARGFSSRTEYMRHILRNRPAVEQTTPDGDLSERVSELEKKIKQIESEIDE